MSAQVAADLRAAADVLERDGWTQHLYVDSNGCRCAAGAILGAIQPGATSDIDLSSDQEERYDAAWAVLWAEVGRGVQLWNDAPGRTAAEVIAALRAAADRAEAER